MKGKVTCPSCGWSWNKSDSSAKDMHVCHNCGKNDVNMKNGGWLDNYNDSKASAPEGFQGEGYSMKGRNYSPAWGGQFEEGGIIPIAQMGMPINPIMPLTNLLVNKFHDWFSEDKKPFQPIKQPNKSTDRTLAIVDPRKKMATTNQPLRPNSDLVGGKYNSHHLDKLIQEAKRQGLSKQDIINLSAMGFQETKWGRSDGNIGHVLHKGDDQGSFNDYTDFVDAYKAKMKEADRLGIKDPAMRLQVYNGLGTIYPSTESKYHGFNMKKIYGVPVPQGGISMKKNPLYGKQVMDIRDNVLAKNPEYMRYMDSIYKAPLPKYMQQEAQLNKQKPPVQIHDVRSGSFPKTQGFAPLVAPKLAPLKKKEMGGTIAGAPGFSYARTINPAPDNGPYAKKTMASAEDGGWLSKYDVAEDGIETTTDETTKPTIDFSKLKQDLENIRNNYKSRKKNINIKQEPTKIVSESTGVGQNMKGKGEKTAEWALNEIKKGNNIVKKRGDYVVTANNKILIPVNREGQQQQYVTYKQLGPGEKLNQEEINKIDIYKDALDKENLGLLRRPLIYLESPEKMLGDIGIPGMETSEDDRLYFAQRDNHPDNANMTLGNSMLNSFNYGLKKVPGAALNLGLAALGNPEAGALRITGEAMNPIPMPLPGRGMKIKPGEETARFFKQVDNLDDASDLIKPKVNPFQYEPPSAPAASIGSDLKQMFANYDPRNLKSESGLDWMKQWYSDPDFARRYNPTGQYNSPSMQQYILDDLNQYQPKNYIDLLKDKGIKQYGKLSGMSGGVSWGVPEGIYHNRTAYFPFNKQGLESVKTHELTHLIENNGHHLGFGDEQALLKPFGIPDVGSIPENPGFFRREMLGDKPQYYLDPTEIHARVNQARFDLGLTPQDTFTEEMFNKISKDKGWYGMGRYIKDKKGFIDLMNNFWAVPPAMIGAGALYQNSQQEEAPQYKKGGVIKDDMGQWNHPGEITEIGSNNITMEGVPYDVLGISDTGDTKLMKPGKNYKFKGKKVTEYPMAKNGIRQEQKGLQNLDNLLNFTNYNTKQPGGWLNKYN